MGNAGGKTGLTQGAQKQAWVKAEHGMGKNRMEGRNDGTREVRPDRGGGPKETKRRRSLQRLIKAVNGQAAERAGGLGAKMLPQSDSNPTPVVGGKGGVQATEGRVQF